MKKNITEKQYNSICNGEFNAITGLTITEILDLLHIVREHLTNLDLESEDDNYSRLKICLRLIRDRIIAIKKEPGVNLLAVAEAEEKAVKLSQKIHGSIQENTIVPDVTESEIGQGDSFFETIRYTVQQITDWTNIMRERISKTEKAFTKFLKSENGAKIKKIFTNFEKLAKLSSDESQNIDKKLWLLDFLENINELYPFVEQELDWLRREKGIDIFTLDEFIRDKDPKTIEQVQSLLETCIERANTARFNKDEYPMLQSILPTRHTMPNNALVNALQKKPSINTGAFDLVVANQQGRRKEITAYTMVTYDVEATGTDLTVLNLTEYERQVSDAIITLWIEAQKQGLPPIFTTDMIFRAMPGGGDKPSPQQRGSITKAIDKMRNLHITVDATDEMRTRRIIGKNEICEFDDFYLSTLRVQRRIKNGGQTVTAYKINTEPVILTYARMTKQILEVSSKYIEVRKIKNGRPAEIMSMTAGRQAMTGYMLRRIMVMKRDNAAAKDALRQYNNRRKKNPNLPEKQLTEFQKQNHVILFETIFTNAGAVTTDRKQNMLNRTFCFEVMDYWKATGLISDYVKQQNGRSITGIVIDL